MNKNSIKYTSFALSILSKLLGSNFQVHGVEKIPKKPVLFVSNHFTRSETFFIPYIINSRTSRHVRCLAHHSLFNGKLGDFLESIGVISTKDKNRDKIIIGDLISGDFDWMIYPEGRMIKNKRIVKRGSYSSVDYNNDIRVKTGAAVLAIKSQIYRSQLIDAYNNDKKYILNQFQEDYNISYNHNIIDIDTNIVPLSVTYYPMRPGKNIIKKILLKLFKDIPDKISEELEIEGNLLLNSEIDIYFGDPISVKDYIKNINNSISQIPIIGNLLKSNLVIKYYRQKLTNNFMSDIYNNIEINFDHIFATVINHLDKKIIPISKIKQLIFLSSYNLSKIARYRINDSLKFENILKIFTDENDDIFQEILQLAISQKIIKQLDDKIEIDFDVKIINNNFNSVRIENSLKVVANEFMMISKAHDIVRRTIEISFKDCSKLFAKRLIEYNLEEYNNDYNKYYDSKLSKDISVGRPIFIDSNSEISVLLIHGYKSAPKEVEELAKNLHSNFNFKIYAIRLKGHATSPINIRDIKWCDWYQNANIGYTMLSAISQKIIIIGFSTGGLLSLLLSSNKNINSKINAIISINSALKLRDIRSHLVKGINLWNDVLKSFQISKARLEYIENIPENPDINYSINYLHGVEQLEILMKKVDDSLIKINNNTLILQGDNDPVVNPKSAEIIYNKISGNKILKYIKANNHVIIRGNNQKESFKVINEYISKLNL